MSEQSRKDRATAPRLLVVATDYVPKGDGFLIRDCFKFRADDPDAMWVVHPESWDEERVGRIVNRLRDEGYAVEVRQP